MNFLKSIIGTAGKLMAAVAIFVAILVVLLVWGLISLITSQPIIVAILIIAVIAGGVAIKVLKK